MSIPALFFTEGGWCEALGASYRPGSYQPKDAAEYNALAPFALDADELIESAPSTITPPDFDLDACTDLDKLHAYAQANGIAYHVRAGVDKVRAAIKAALEPKV